MLRNSMFAALMVALFTNVAVFAEAPAYEQGLKDLAAKAATVESSLSSAETEAVQAAKVVKEAAVKVTQAESLLAGLKKAQADLQAAEGNIAPKQQAEADADFKLQAAQTADEKKAAAVAYNKAVSEYESAKNAPIGLRAIYAKQYSFADCQAVDAGLKTKVTETENLLVELRKQLVLDEEALSVKTDAVSALKAEAEKVDRKVDRAYREAALTEQQANRMLLQVVGKNTSDTAVAVKEAVVAVEKVEAAVVSVHKANMLMLAELSAVKTADEAVQEDIDVVRTTIDGLMRKFPNDPAVQQRINGELKKTMDVLPIPTPVSKVVTPAPAMGTTVFTQPVQQCRTGSCPQTYTSSPRVYQGSDGRWYQQ